MVTSQDDCPKVDLTSYQATLHLEDLLVCLRQKVLSQHGLFGFRAFRQQLH